MAQGASAIYPIIGSHAYGWTFVASDIDNTSLQAAKTIAKNNPTLKKHVTFRLQNHPQNIFQNIIQEQEHYDLSLCNPPFHASLEEALEANRTKRAKLHRHQQQRNPLNKTAPPKNGSSKSNHNQ